MMSFLCGLTRCRKQHDEGNIRRTDRRQWRNEASLAVAYQADLLRIDLLASLEILHSGQRIAREILDSCFEEVGDAISRVLR